tara:strand:- start:198 stop:773 length:576 start_codon:yes stop_codon:yes gene_type:complete
MRIFLSLLILIFGLQSWTKADDIREFELEGISIGDSLLDHFSRSEIIEATRKNQYQNKDGKFIDVNFFDENFSFIKIYDALLISYKKNDKNYEIYSLSGGMFFKNDISKCLEMQKSVDNDLSNLFENAKRKKLKKKYRYDETGKSFVHFITYYLKNGDEVDTACYEFAEYLDRQHYLLVSVDTKEFKDWLD